MCCDWTGNRSSHNTFFTGNRSSHSTETVLVRVTNDLLMLSDAGSPSLLILLDLSAAFDTVEHDLLLNRLHFNTDLSWFHLCLKNQTKHISLGLSTSKPTNSLLWCSSGVSLWPQPLHPLLYLVPHGQVINRHGFLFDCYADDTQLYVNATAATPCSLSSSSQLLRR